MTSSSVGDLDLESGEADETNDALVAPSRRKRDAQGGLLDTLVSAVSSSLTSAGGTNIHVAMASCSGKGEEEFHMREARVFLKSILLFNPKNLHLHIFATPTNKAYLRRLLKEWKRDTYLDFQVSFYDTTFPNATFKAPVYRKKGVAQAPEEEDVSWSNLFRPCSSQRLFIPWGVKTLDKIIYLDADLIVLGSLAELWQQFDHFDDQQFLGLAPIAFHHIAFTLKRKIPTVGKYGHNAGVALMHAERIREIDWRDEMLQLGIKIRQSVNVLGDQDMINYYMHNHPEGFYEISCKYNYRREYCTPFRGEPQECLDAKDGGTVVLHGVADTFITNQTIFRYIFQVFERFEFGMSIEKDLLDLLKFVFVLFEEDKCGNVGDIMYKKIAEYISQYSSIDVVGKVPSELSMKGRNRFSG